ncbi:MAG: hypothetical protein IKL13_00330 [Clostridia bacterium]|nr:hypothetical protein [Clostridia bacterium]
MKQKFYRLCNRHRWVPVALSLVYITLCFCIIAPGDATVMKTVFYIAAAMLLLSSFVVGAGCGGKRMNPAVKMLNDRCDPHPLLAECDDQLSYVKNRGNRQLLTVNRAAALIELGREEEALAALEALNIDNPTPLPIWRYIYYHNAALAALSCGQREKAEIYRHKAHQQAATITHKKYQDLISSSTQGLNTEMCLDAKDYDGARRILEQSSIPAGTSSQVNRAYQIGRLELAQGNHTVARFQLEFVVQNGNRLAIVDKARALLEAM